MDCTSTAAFDVVGRNLRSLTQLLVDSHPKFEQQVYHNQKKTAGRTRKSSGQRVSKPGLEEHAKLQLLQGSEE